MNYYIQGCAAKADKIKAAFEKLGCKNTSNCIFEEDNKLYFTFNGRVEWSCYKPFIDIIKSHPDYKELELSIEPKFKVGDWIVQNDNGTVSQIIKVINDTDEYGKYRAYEHTNGYFAACFENEYHLWSIQDAKDGDVITNGKLIVIFNKLEEPTYRQHIIAYVGLDLCGRLQITKDTWQLGVGNAIPATKEQRDLLFKKIKEAGYQWDADKKELRKIKPHYDIANFHAGMPVLVRDYNNSQWSYVQFSHLIAERNVGEGGFKFNACGIPYIQCIPFDGNEHLLGTTDMCDEQFINW